MKVELTDRIEAIKCIKAVDDLLDDLEELHQDTEAMETSIRFGSGYIKDMLFYVLNFTVPLLTALHLNHTITCQMFLEHTGKSYDALLKQLPTDFLHIVTLS